MSQKRYPWWQPVMGALEQEYVSGVIASGFPNDGPLCTQLEDKVAAICQTKYAISLTNCTSGLYLSLLAAGIGPGDEVLVPDITFIATANAVSMTGARPVLIDTSISSFCIDPQAAKAAITSRTKAIIPVHVTGRPADMQSIMALASEHNLVIIEDAAEALGSKYKGQPLGSFGLTGCFSFSPAKIITTGQGGMIVTSDAQVHARLRELKDQGRPVRGTGGDDLHVSLGFNFKFTDLQAAMGLAQISTIDWRIERMRRHYQIYRDLLVQSEQIWLPEVDLAGGNCPQWIDIYCHQRDSLYDFLKAQSMECRKFWHPIHSQKPYLTDFDLPVSSAISNHSMWLPSALQLSDDDIATVCQQINTWSKLYSRTASKV